MSRQALEDPRMEISQLLSVLFQYCTAVMVKKKVSCYICLQFVILQHVYYLLCYPCLSFEKTLPQISVYPSIKYLYISIVRDIMIQRRLSPRTFWISEFQYSHNLYKRIMETHSWSLWVTARFETNSVGHPSHIILDLEWVSFCHLLVIQLRSNFYLL